jgi:glucose uptake protein
MVLPTTWLSAILLLVLSFICLGSWANTFKATGSRWRFELFSIDFAVGALLVAVLAAYTLGTLGSDLSFSDRMLVAGRTNQALGIIAGAVFALGNMLLLAAVSLLGMSAAFPLCIGSAVAIAVLFQFRTAPPLWLVAGLALVLCAVVLAVVAIRAAKKSARAPVPRPGVRTSAKKTSPWTKGIAAGVISGIALGCFFPILNRSFRGDFGLGPYAGLLLVTIALLISTLVLNLYFMNIAISGVPIGFGAYFTGLPHQHFLGFAGGAVWAIGLLAQGLAMSASASVDLDPAMKTIAPLASVALAVFWGLVKWKEFATGPDTKSGRVRAFLLASTAVFLGGIALVGLAARVTP